MLTDVAVAVEPSPREATTWVEEGCSGVAPTARYGHSMAYDPKSKSMIVFGGRVGSRGPYRLGLGTVSRRGSEFLAQMTTPGGWSWRQATFPKTVGVRPFVMNTDAQRKRAHQRINWRDIKLPRLCKLTCISAVCLGRPVRGSCSCSAWTRLLRVVNEREPACRYSKVTRLTLVTSSLTS